MNTFGTLIGTTVDRFVRAVVIPVTAVIPFLVSSGICLVVYGAIWLAFGAAALGNPAALDDAWSAVAALALPVQALVWLLFLPVMAGLWVWGTDWPELVRFALIAGLGAWSVLIFIPRREQPLAAGSGS